MPIRQTPFSKEVPVNVVGGSTFGRYKYISAEKTYNMFVSDGWLVNTAGYKRVYELLASGSGRGIFKSVRGNFILVVVNATVYRLDENLSPTLIGILNSTSGEVFIDENLANQICIVDGVDAYIYNHSLAPNLTVQTLNASLIPNYVTYHDTFFLFGNANPTSVGAKWYAYKYNTDTTITEQSELALQTKPDYAVAIKRIPGQGNNVLVFGTTVCEVHTHVGGLENYLRNPTISVDYGCLSVSTIASSDHYIAWLGVNESNAPVIMVYSGQGAQEISTDGINYLLAQLVHPDRSTAMFYRQDGHLFYQLTFYASEDNLTLIYDFNTQQFFNLSDGHLNYHPARDVVYFNHKSYFISLNNASLYEMSTDYTTYDENINTNDPALAQEIQRIRICGNIREPNSARFIANSLMLTIEQGYDPRFTGLSYQSNNAIITEVTLDDVVSESGSPLVVEGATASSASELPVQYTSSTVYRPRVDLSISYDGGVTFGTTVSNYMRQVGNRKNVMSWQKMGAANDLTLKFRFWGTSRFVVNNAQLQVY